MSGRQRNSFAVGFVLRVRNSLRLLEVYRALSEHNGEVEAYRFPDRLSLTQSCFVRFIDR